MDDLNDQFCIACQNGNLELAQQLLRENLDIDISASEEYAFRSACCNGHLEVAQWLLQVKPDIDISARDECAFRSVCYFGHLEVAQWLFTIKSDIDISANNEYAFRWACEYGRLKVAQWLADEVKPERYEITEVTSNARGKYTIQYKIYENNDRPMYYILK